MFHDSTAVLALSREENPTVFQKTLALNDFYFGGDDFEFPLGNVQMVGKSTAPMFRGERPRDTKLAPEWTLERMARHAIDFWLSTEDLPQADNRVTVEPDGNIKLTYTETNLEAKKRLYEKVKSMLGELNMNPGHLIHRFAYMKNDIPIAGCAHQAGTCRFGTDPTGVSARRELQGARARQPLRRRHECLPEHRRGEPGPHGDGELAPRRRPPTGATGVTSTVSTAAATDAQASPSGEQVEIRHGDQRAVIVEFGGGPPVLLRRRPRRSRRLRRRGAGHLRPWAGAHPVAQPNPGRALSSSMAASISCH